MLGQDFAVMLNANARRVTPEVRRRVERIVSPDHLFYSHSADESRDIVNTIASRGYSTVFTGGGDGTFIKFVNDYADTTKSSSAVLPAKVGVLHLGTGNAVASIVSSPNYETDLQSFVHTRTRDFQALPLVQAEGARFPFAGLGIDAEILNDYMAIKHGIGQNPWVKPLVQNVGGYFAAFFGRTCARRLRSTFSGGAPRTEVRITNLGDTAYILQGGEPVKAYGRGEVLYEGPTTTTIFGTCPFYGHGMTVLPHGLSRPGYFQLRMVGMGVTRAVANLPAIWKGTYHGAGLFDWHVKRVKLEFSRPMPYQYGGDAQGERTELEVGIAPIAVDLLRFI